MNLKTKLFTLLFASVAIISLHASNSHKSEIQKVLYWADWIKNNEYATYSDYENELNYETIDAPVDDKYEFLQTELAYTKKSNLYCSEIHLKGIKDRMLAMMQIEGSGRFPYLKIFRFDGKKKKWKIYYSGKGSLGECGLVYPVTDPITGYTFFFEEVRDFDSKRLISYDLLSFSDKKWKVFASAHARYVYNLTDDEKQWLSSDIIEKMASFDYSFMGVESERPEIIERKFNDKKIIAKPYYTSVGHMASNFDITVLRMARETAKTDGKVFEDEKELLKLGNCWWGLNFVEKNGNLYLVCIGMGESGEPRVSTIEDFVLNVIDLSTLETVHRTYIKCDIVFE